MGVKHAPSIREEHRPTVPENRALMRDEIIGYQE
jgi:hypothetical protein